MKTVFQTLLRAIAGTSDDDRARQVLFLKAENEILRGKLPKRITVTAPERQRLVKLGKPLGAAIQALISIVAPRTFLRWVQGEATPKPQATTAPKAGRPRTKAEIRELVLKLARETGWGYTRILGELKKLGVGNISRSTVVNILKKEGIDTGPRRGEGTWDAFIKRHAQTLWACDFFSKKVWTLCGKVEVFVLFFLHIGTRRVHIAGMTANPDKQWMTQQARNLRMFFADQPVPPRFLLRDNDSKFVPEFDAILQDEGIEVKRLPLRSPNLNRLGGLLRHYRRVA